MSTGNQKCIENVISSWTMRNPSMVGKIKIVKSLLASNFSYIGSIVDLHQVFVNRINIFFFFKSVCGGSKRNKRSTLINAYVESGLKMLNFYLYLDSLKILWLKNSHHQERSMEIDTNVYFQQNIFRHQYLKMRLYNR